MIRHNGQRYPEAVVKKPSGPEKGRLTPKGRTPYVISLEERIRRRLRILAGKGSIKKNPYTARIREYVIREEEVTYGNISRILELPRELVQKVCVHLVSTGDFTHGIDVKHREYISVL